MTFTDENPHACCNGPRPEDAHDTVLQLLHPHTLTHLTNKDRMNWKTNPWQAHNCTSAKTPLHIHTSPGPDQNPHTPPKPAEATTTQPKHCSV